MRAAIVPAALVHARGHNLLPSAHVNRRRFPGPLVELPGLDDPRITLLADAPDRVESVPLSAIGLYVRLNEADARRAGLLDDEPPYDLAVWMTAEMGPGW